MTASDMLVPLAMAGSGITWSPNADGTGDWTVAFDGKYTRK